MASPENNKKESLSDELKSAGINYNPNAPKLPGEIPEEQKKEIDKTKQKLEEFKKEALKKFPFILAMGIIPPQAADRFDEELGLTPEEKKLKPMHLTVVIPEENYKDLPKIRPELIKIVKDMKPMVWINIITPVDLANYCLDSKYDISEAIGMSYPLHDKGILGAFRISSIHKSLCLRKFEKYIYSYVVFGSLIRGEAKENSDIDVFIIIDDTDVKRMSRLELKEKLRGIIYQYVAEATELAGVKSPLHVQVYLLTEFWEDVKDASPVIFTAIRDGIPLYDRGGFLPWKLLLKMGKITPSPEAIDKFMSMGEKTKEMVNRRMIDAMIDIFWSVSSPSQALLMLYGIPPPGLKETVKEMRRIFVEEEKMLEPKYVNFLEKMIIKYWKGYEYGQLKEISGKEVDELLKESEEYIKRLGELREQIEKKSQERILNGTYENVFKLLKNLFGAKTETELIKDFEKELIKKGRTDPKNLKVLNEIVDAKKKFKTKKKPSKYEIEDIRKNASYLINSMIEYAQRCELVEISKMQLKVEYEEGKEKIKKQADIFLTNPNFVIIEGAIKKVDKSKLIDAIPGEFEKILGEQKNKPSKLTKETLECLRKEIGVFEIKI